MDDHGWVGPIEWAVAARPRSGEEACGDQAVAMAVNETAALFGVLDGLGHGNPAARAALCGVQTLRRDPSKPLGALVGLCHRVMATTRGAAMTLARIDFDVDTLTWTGIGNVGANLVVKAPSGTAIRASAYLTGGIVGHRIPDDVRTQVTPIRPGDLLVMASDGIANDHLDTINFSSSAAVIAEQILFRYRKETDDALVLAARHRGPLS